MRTHIRTRTSILHRIPVTACISVYNYGNPRARTHTHEHTHTCTNGYARTREHTCTYTHTHTHTHTICIANVHVVRTDSINSLQPANCDHPRMDTTVPTPLSQYPWISQLTVTIHGWTQQYLPLCHSIHGYHSYCDHPWMDTTVPSYP